MKFSIGAITILTTILLSIQALACGEQDPDNGSSIRLNSAEPVCGEGKDKDGDNAQMGSFGFCGEGKDKDGDNIQLSMNGFCGEGKDGDNDGMRLSQGACGE